MIRKIGLACCVCLCAFFLGAAARQKPVNKLEKAMLYVKSGQKRVGVTSANIDLGRIVLLFSDQKPVMNLMPMRNVERYGRIVSRKKDTYLFPFSKIKSSECKKMVERINTAQNVGYNFQLKEVAKPIAGLQLSIAYDPSKVSFEYRFFETISSRKGVEFRFYDKSLINKLSKRLNASTRVSCTKKKELSLLTAGMVESTRAPWGFLA